jgi:hypothetical protein
MDLARLRQPVDEDLGRATPLLGASVALVFLWFLLPRIGPLRDLRRRS